MRRVKTPRIISQNIRLQKSSPNLSFNNVTDIKSYTKGSPLKQVEISALNDSTLITHFNSSPKKLRDIIKGLEETNKKLVIENFRIKEENNTLVKTNKELQAKSIEQQKYISRLNVEISKLSQQFYRASNELGNGRGISASLGGRLKNSAIGKKIPGLFVERNKSVDYLINRNKLK